MKAFLASTFLLSLISFTQASADSHARLGKRAIHQLLGRQSVDPSSVPPGCESACAAILADTNRCKFGAGATCFCNDTVEKDFVQCKNCIVAANGGSDSDVKKAQSQVDQLVNICAQGGYTLPAATVVPATGISVVPKSTSTPALTSASSAAPSATGASKGNGALPLGDASGLTLALGGLVGALIAF